MASNVEPVVASGDLIAMDIHPLKPWLALAFADATFALVDYLTREELHRGTSSDFETGLESFLLPCPGFLAPSAPGLVPFYVVSGSEPDLSLLGRPQ